MYKCSWQIFNANLIQNIPRESDQSCVSFKEMCFPVVQKIQLQTSATHDPVTGQWKWRFSATIIHPGNVCPELT